MNGQSPDTRIHHGRRWGAVVGLLLIALVSAAVAYNLGLARGLAQASAAAGGALPPPAYYGYYGPHFWGVGFFMPFLFFALWFVTIRALFWRGFRRREWDGGPRGGASRFDEWHRQAHERMNSQTPAVDTGNVNPPRS